MVYKFRLLSDEVKDFVRDIEIRSDQTFYDFHKLIQDEFGYDSSQIASFFIANKKWEKDKEFTLFDMSDEENNQTIPMDKAILKNFIHDPRQRLIYVFDVFNERSFFIELIETQKEIKYSDYPAVIFAKGNPPQQILFGPGNFGSFQESDFSGMEVDEDVNGLDTGELDTETGEDSAKDIRLDESEGNQDAEPEE